MKVAFDNKYRWSILDEESEPIATLDAEVASIKEASRFVKAAEIQAAIESMLELHITDHNHMTHCRARQVIDYIHHDRDLPPHTRRQSMRLSEEGNAVLNRDGYPVLSINTDSVSEVGARRFAVADLLQDSLQALLQNHEESEFIDEGIRQYYRSHTIHKASHMLLNSL